MELRISSANNWPIISKEPFNVMTRETPQADTIDSSEANACSGARRWSDIPKSEQKSGWWKAVPNDDRTHLDGWDFEIVYVYYDGHWSVLRAGESTRETLADFVWLSMVNLF